MTKNKTNRMIAEKNSNNDRRSRRRERKIGAPVTRGEKCVDAYHHCCVHRLFAENVEVERKTVLIDRSINDEQDKHSLLDSFHLRKRMLDVDNLSKVEIDASVLIRRHSIIHRSVAIMMLMMMMMQSTMLLFFLDVHFTWCRLYPLSMFG